MSLLSPKPSPDATELPDAVRNVISSVKKQRLTYLSYKRLRSLAELCRSAEKSGRQGILIEAGCALGGSAIVLCATKSVAQPLKVYDVFEMIPPPGEKDGEDVHVRFSKIEAGRSKGIGGDVYYGYRSNLYEQVSTHFADAGYPCGDNTVSLIKGLVQDTLTGEEPVVLAHVDVDWFEPVMTCLERIVPRLVPGGAIVMDDYLHWSGCATAVNEYFDRVGRAGFDFDESPGHLIVKKLP